MTMVICHPHSCTLYDEVVIRQSGSELHQWLQGYAVLNLVILRYHLSRYSKKCNSQTPTPVMNNLGITNADTKRRIQEWP